jgi:hypothetical protein
MHRILLRSAWQTVNIGDIGHTPGALSVLSRHYPEAEVTLWPGDVGRGTREMLLATFPKLKIAEGTLDPDGRPTTAELAAAWQWADMGLWGSGSGFPHHHQAAAFHRATGKPVGVFAVSTDPISGFDGGRDPEGGTLASLRDRAMKLPPTHLGGEMRYILDRAAFMFCRDTISRDYLLNQQVKTPICEFGPDAQLGMFLRDDIRGDAYRADHRLEEGRFIAVIPRSRYTPYWSIQGRPPGESDGVRVAINERTDESDNARLRDLIVHYVRNTGGRVLACPEMTYQIELAKQTLFDPLPADVKPNVVWRDTYWLPDEAASIYAKALAVVSMECHSPLIAYHQGTPAIHVRQPTDTCKGQMYADIGAGEWLFEVEETDGQQLWSRLAVIHRDPASARAKVRQIMSTVDRLQRRMVDAVRETATK